MQTNTSQPRRPALLFAAAVVVAAALGFGPSAEARAGRQMDVRDFMTGLACVESGGRYDAVNKRSGAYGRYQIMPRNWPAWAARYMGNRWAEPTPRNQEFVARQRILDLYALHGSWRLVALWWRTGNAHADERLWSPGSVGYVRRVMRFARAAASRSPSLSAVVPSRCRPVSFPDPKVREKPWPRVFVSGGRVNVRRRPGYEYRSITTVARGERLAVLGRGSDPRGQRWLYVGLRDGTTGWVAAWLTRPARTR